MSTRGIDLPTALRRRRAFDSADARERSGNRRCDLAELEPAAIRCDHGAVARGERRRGDIPSLRRSATSSSRACAAAFRIAVPLSFMELLPAV
jgi:hypothetical protein